MRGEKFIIYSLSPLESKAYNPVLGSQEIIINENKDPIILTFN